MFKLNKICAQFLGKLCPGQNADGLPGLALLLMEKSSVLAAAEACRMDSMEQGQQ